MLFSKFRATSFIFICFLATFNIYNYISILQDFVFEPSDDIVPVEVRRRYRRSSNTPRRLVCLTSSDCSYGASHRMVQKMTRKQREDSDKSEDSNTIHVPLDEGDINPNDKAATIWKGRATRTQVYERYGNTTSEQCAPMADWHSSAFPTCNTMHEADLRREILWKKAHGFYRDMWLFLYKGGDAKVYASNESRYWGEPYALKTLKISMRFTKHRYDQHRIDALVTERLTFSKNAIKIFSYCGHSVINSLEATHGYLAVKRKGFTPLQKLKLAIDAATALADLHSIYGNKNNVTTVIHRDIRGSNFLLSRSGNKFVIHDFNLARFPMWNAETNAPCGILKPECTPYRSPEECLGRPITEKIDVYSLGHMFYIFLMELEPYFYPEKIPDRTVDKLIVQGIRPKLNSSVANSVDPAIVAIRSAMEQCYTYDPKDRPSASQIAKYLTSAFESAYRNFKMKIL